MAKKIIFFLLLVAPALNMYADEPVSDLFSYDFEKIYNEYAGLNELESYLKIHPEAEKNEILRHFPEFAYLYTFENYIPAGQTHISSPGNLPSFWVAFAMSAVGTYFIYGAVAGPISVAIVYASSKRDKRETKKAIWGCISGTLIGAGIKYAVVNL